MKRWIALSIAVLSTLAPLACGSGDPEAGVDCATSDDCGSLTCFCAADPVPGVCSKSCNADADCAGLGDGYSCSKEFCTGVNVCLRLTSM